MTIFYERTKALCKKNKLHMNQLEINIDIKKNTSSNWRRKTPQGDIALKVAQYFQVSTDYLLGNTDTPDIQGVHYAEKTQYIINICEANPDIAGAIYQLIESIERKRR